MKQPPPQQRVVERMAPGVLCGEGFLGDTHRDLDDILLTDAAEVEALGLTHQQIATALHEILDAAIAAMGRPTPVRGGLTAAWHEAMGRIPSPWPGEGVFPKGEVELTDPSTGRSLRFAPLSVHLIDRHGFYQGRGSRYRLEPAGLARLLDIAGSTG